MESREQEINPYIPPQASADVTTTGRFYTPLQICLGAFLGGPLAAGYFYSRDHILFGSPGKAWTSLVLSGVILCCLFAFGISFPSFARHGNEIIPPAIIAGMYRWFAQKTFDQAISLRRDKGWTAYSWWRAIGLSIIGLTLTLAVLFALLLLLPERWTNVEGQVKSTREVRAPVPQPASMGELPAIVAKLAANKVERSWIMFAFAPPGEEENESAVLNLQYSIEDGKLGVDWFLLGPRNVADDMKVTAFIEHQNFVVKMHTVNGVKFLRTEGNDLAELGRKIICELYHVKPDGPITLYAGVGSNPARMEDVLKGN
jgi:hypothetical protein